MFEFLTELIFSLHSLFDLLKLLKIVDNDFGFFVAIMSNQKKSCLLNRSYVHFNCVQILIPFRLNCV